MRTSWPIRLLRAAYRLFQSDAGWEWPFRNRTVRAYARAFDLVERRGLLGRAKWMALESLLPLLRGFLEGKGRSWHSYDWTQSASSDTALCRCMHVTMRLRKK